MYMCPQAEEVQARYWLPYFNSLSQVWHACGVAVISWIKQLAYYYSETEYTMWWADSTSSVSAQKLMYVLD